MKNLDKYEKLKAFQEYNFCRNERKIGVRYLNAIRTNNQDVIDYFESYGDNLHKIILNVKTHERNIEFGFSVVDVFNEYGWVKYGRLKETQVIQLDERNRVFVRVSPNGKWVHGSDCSTNDSGSYTGGSIWSTPFTTEQEALISGLKEFIVWYKKELKNCQRTSDEYDEETRKVIKVSAKENYCKKIIKLAEKELQQIKTPQLELF